MLEWDKQTYHPNPECDDNAVKTCFYYTSTLSIIKLWSRKH